MRESRARRVNDRDPRSELPGRRSKSFPRTRAREIRGVGIGDARRRRLRANAASAGRAPTLNVSSPRYSTTKSRDCPPLPPLPLFTLISSRVTASGFVTNLIRRERRERRIKRNSAETAYERANEPTLVKTKKKRKRTSRLA